MGGLLVVVGLVMICVGIIILFGFGWVVILLSLLDPKMAMPIGIDKGHLTTSKNPKTRIYGKLLFLGGILILLIGAAIALVK